MPELSTAAARAAAAARHGTDPIIVLLTLAHESDDDPVYVACDWTNVSSRGNTYQAYPLRHELPGDGEQAIEAKLTIANTSRQLGWKLEAWITPPQVTIEIVLRSDPDTVVRSWTDLTFVVADWDRGFITATLQRLGFWDEPCPRQMVTPIGFPGLVP